MSYSPTLFRSRSIAASTRWPTSSTSARQSEIAWGSARSKPMPRVLPPISLAAAFARAWSRPVTTTARPSSAYDCASSRPSPCVPPTMMTLPVAMSLSPFAPKEARPARSARTEPEGFRLDGCHRLGCPVREQFAARQDVIPRLVELLEDVVEVDVDELSVSLHCSSGDEHRVHVGRVREDHDRPDGVDHRSGVDRVHVEEDDVRLLPRSERPDLVLERASPGTVDRRELEDGRVRQRWRAGLLRRLGVGEDPVVDERRAHLGEHLSGDAGDDVDAE